MELVSGIPILPPRESHGHKGTFGSVLVIGGHAANPMMLGGPALAARAALRSGCGLCTLAMPAPLLAAALGMTSSATGCELEVDAAGEIKSSAAAETLDPIVARMQAVVVGPGLGAGFAVQQLTLRLAVMVETTLVIDADALNALAATPDFARDMKAPIILTPHPGEFARLAKGLQLDADAMDPNTRARAACEMAARLGCVVALKGANTVVSDGVRVWICEAVEPALATGGSGDTLSGLIAGLAAQFARGTFGAPLTLFDLTRLAVHLHALSAAMWSAKHGHAGMLALEIADGIPDAMAAMRS